MVYTSKEIQFYLAIYFVYCHHMCGEELKYHVVVMSLLKSDLSVCYCLKTIQLLKTIIFHVRIGVALRMVVAEVLVKTAVRVVKYPTASEY